MSENVGQSYNEQILQSIIDGTPYENQNPYPSRIEVLLMELKEAIEAGGGTIVIDQTFNPDSENAQAGKAVAQAINNKVDKVSGKGLSSNDFTDADVAKLSGIAEGAEVNVQSDWDQTNTSADDFIKNKPSLLELGETSSTAYPGDKGKANADAITAIKDGQTIDSFGDVETALADKADVSSTYDKTEVDKMVKGYSSTSDNGSFSSLIHNAATYCGVNDSGVVNGFVVVTTDDNSEYLLGFFNFKYMRNVVFATISNNNVTYGAQSQYGTLTFSAVTGTSYKATVTFI